MIATRTLRHITAASLFAGGMVFGQMAYAAGDAPEVERKQWSFSGFFGTFDRPQLQRGFQVYSEVCAACHGLNRIAYRNLAEPGGPEFPEDDVKALAATVQIMDGPNDEGEMYERPGRLSDHKPPPFPNKEAGRALHNAYPPDLSLITKARGVPYTGTIWYHPLAMLTDIVNGYQEGGADYMYGLLTGYSDPPSYVRQPDGKLTRVSGDEAPEGAMQCASTSTQENGPDICNKLGDVLNYNKIYPGHQIAMAAPLAEGIVEYTDGTPGTVSNYAADVAAFLSWAADPHLEKRKQLGWQVLLYLLVTALLLYVAKRRIWARVKH